MRITFNENELVIKTNDAVEIWNDQEYAPEVPVSETIYDSSLMLTPNYMNHEDEN